MPKSMGAMQILRRRLANAVGQPGPNADRQAERQAANKTRREANAPRHAEGNPARQAAEAVRQAANQTRLKANAARLAAANPATQTAQADAQAARQTAQAARQTVHASRLAFSCCEDLNFLNITMPLFSACERCHHSFRVCALSSCHFLAFVMVCSQWMRVIRILHRHHHFLSSDHAWITHPIYAISFHYIDDR